MERAGAHARGSLLRAHFQAEMQNMHLKANVQRFVLRVLTCCRSSEAEPWRQVWKAAARVNRPCGERSAASPKGLSER